jgi:hypothetical protein
MAFLNDAGLERICRHVFERNVRFYVLKKGQEETSDSLVILDCPESAKTVGL